MKSYQAQIASLCSFDNGIACLFQQFARMTQRKGIKKRKFDEMACLNNDKLALIKENEILDRGDGEERGEKAISRGFVSSLLVVRDDKWDKTY